MLMLVVSCAEQVLDVGNNYLASMNDLKVVGVLPYLLNINVNGNKVSESEDIVDKVSVTTTVHMPSSTHSCPL